jgi:hypothetical protein
LHNPPLLNRLRDGMSTIWEAGVLVKELHERVPVKLADGEKRSSVRKLAHIGVL